MMSPSQTYFTDLPAEISERILLHLPGQDIIKMEGVSRYFTGLVRGSPTLQYLCELFSAGLIDNPHHPCDLSERRRLCKEYVDKWTGTAKVVKKTVRWLHGVPNWNRITVLGGGLLTLYHSSQPGLAKLMRVPSATSQRLVERWTIPRLPFEVLHFTAYAPENLLAAVEQRGRTVQIHLLNLQDGTPYRGPHSDQTTCEISSPFDRIFVYALAVTCSRVMMFASSLSMGGVGWIVVWDRQSRDLVLNISTAESTLLGWGSKVVFLDEFRVLVTNRDHATGVPELVVFDTLVPQDHPKSFRQFRFPLRYRRRSPHIHVDPDRPLGSAKYGPLIVDPTQAILAVELMLVGFDMGPRVLLALRTNVLTEHDYSSCTCPRIPWEEWGESTVVVEIPSDQIYRDNFSTFVHGTHMAVMTRASGNDPEYHLHTFDFSKRGRHALPPRSGEGDGTERRSVLEDGRKLVLGGDESMPTERLVMLCDGTVAYMDWVGGRTSLHVWEVV